MRKFRRIVYIVLIAIIATMSFIIYSNASKNNSDENQKEKVLSEIKYIESKLVDLMNSMNNIKERNYSIEVGKLSEDATKKTSEKSQESQNTSEAEGSSSGSGTSKERQGDSDNSGSENQEQQKKFDMKLEGVLTTNEEINWDYIKSQIEILYTSIPTITLDLYQLDINKQDILKFNQEFDNLTIIIKNQEKEKTLAQISKLYDFLPKFVEHATNDNLYKTTINTKNNIFKGYSKLDSKDWEGIGKDNQNAINNYNKLLSDTNIENNKHYRISKLYVMLNELQNAIKIQDVSVYLIKYKNLIEEIDNL